MRWIRRLVAESLAAAALLGAPASALLEERVSREQAEHTQPKEKSREYSGGAGVMLNDIFGGGNVRLKSGHEWFLDQKRVSWSDHFSASYEYASVFDGRKLSEKEKLQNTRRIFSVGYHLAYQGRPFADLRYYSDGSLDVSALYLTGGFQQRLFPGFSAEAGFGLRTGTNVQVKGEKSDILSLAMKYKSGKKGDFQTDASFSFLMPRRYINGDAADGLWTMDGRVAFASGQKIGGMLLPAVSFFYTRDYALFGSGKTLEFVPVQRYGVSFGFDLQAGGNEEK
ncbi:MAG TPA: hypothetical protein VJC16_03820 [Candidatus Nanoarchaeia archaeon]|nr:hypothetical protein [Candidatus Nanoarchaeia archaeon]